jgi:hypothetical protein
MRELTRRFFQLEGCALEESETGLKVQLSPPLRNSFEAETLDLVFRPSAHRQGELISAGSRSFERILEHLKKEGMGCELQLYLPQAEPSTTLELAVRVSYLTEERHDTLLMVNASSSGNAQMVERSALLELPLDAKPKAPFAPIETSLLQELCTRAVATLEARLGEEASTREQRVLEALAGELRRLSSHFGELIAQNELDDAVREELAAELDRCVADEVARHRLEVQLELLGYALIRVQNHDGQG